MITTIQSIKQFGVFEDFHWPADLVSFKKFNLIYGWNYSGKTTLSRAFRCFEEGPHEDFPGAEVRLKDEDGRLHNLLAPGTAPEIRVFNSDFVQDNLRFDSGTSEPILVLGAEDIEKLEALNAKKAERAATATDIESIRREHDQKANAISTALTRHAASIKNSLSKPKYDKTPFTRAVEQCMANPDSHLLDEDELKDCLSVHQSTERKPTLTTLNTTIPSVGEQEEKSTPLIERVVTASNRISRLSDNSTLEAWVNDGRPLHEGKKDCQFCGQPIPAKLLAQLSAHFSAEYEHLMEELKALVKDITDEKKKKVKIPHESELYPELSGRFIREKARLFKLSKARDESLETLVNALIAKQTKAFTSLEPPTLEDPTVQIKEAIASINTTITDHNQRTDQFERNRKEAFDKLENHYAASFVRDERYKTEIKAIGSLESALERAGERIADLDKDIRELEQATSDATKGAERINELLAASFGKDDLRIEVSADKRFQIIRGKREATNLSEGEKTAIAFAYFITRVQDGRNPLEETIVVIDDPVSSLDANHTFNTYAVIKTQLAKCHQLFVFTHSFEFFSLMKEWAGEKEDLKKPALWKRWSGTSENRRGLSE